MIIEYRCLSCGQKAPEGHPSMICPCGGKLRGKAPGITGTRDSFGIGRKFYHEGSEITNWKQWERAGFRNPLESPTISKEHKSVIKEKVKAVKQGHTGFSVGLK